MAVQQLMKMAMPIVARRPVGIFNLSLEPVEIAQGFKAHNGRSGHHRHGGLRDELDFPTLVAGQVTAPVGHLPGFVEALVLLLSRLAMD